MIELILFLSSEIAPLKDILLFKQLCFELRHHKIISESKINYEQSKDNSRNRYLQYLKIDIVNYAVGTKEKSQKHYDEGACIERVDYELLAPIFCIRSFLIFHVIPPVLNFLLLHYEI
jgi:hypothetical protein